MPSGPRPRVDVLVPAHDEAACIEATVAALLRQLAPGDRVIVIADNCRDETAALALRAGACVLERRHPERFGKGYALAAGVEFTHADPPSVVLVVDADTRPGEGLVATLATLAHATGRPVQAAYTLEPPRDAWLGARLSAFAFRLRNQVRPRGLARLGLPCGLTGSGMAIPWQRLRAATLAHGRTAEDLALGVELALAGAPPLFCDDVGVVGRLPERPADAFAQRRRWEHGHLAVAFASTASLLQAATAQRHPALAALALDLCVPPLSLWGLLWLAAAVPAVALAVLGGAAAPLALLALAGALNGGAVALRLAPLRSRSAAAGRLARGTRLLAREAALASRLPAPPRGSLARERTTTMSAPSGGSSLTAWPRTVALGPLRVHTVTQAECVAHLLRELEAGRGGWLLTANLDHLRLCDRDPDYLRLCREASLVVADGMPLVWASRLQRTPLPERVAGSDLLGSLCAAAAGERALGLSAGRSAGRRRGRCARAAGSPSRPAAVRNRVAGAGLRTRRGRARSPASRGACGAARHRLPRAPQAETGAPDRRAARASCPRPGSSAWASASAFSRAACAARRRGCSTAGSSGCIGSCRSRAASRAAISCRACPWDCGCSAPRRAGA